jgi:hypothetical protein
MKKSLLILVSVAVVALAVGAAMVIFTGGKTLATKLAKWELGVKLAEQWQNGSSLFGMIHITDAHQRVNMAFSVPDSLALNPSSGKFSDARRFLPPC